MAQAAVPMTADAGLYGRMVVEARCATRQGFVDYAGVGFYDRDGNAIDVFDRDGNTLSAVIPVVFRWSCRNPRCSDRIPGKVTVHRETLYGVQHGKGIGEVLTQDEDTRPLNELIQYLPPSQVRHIERG